MTINAARSTRPKVIFAALRSMRMPMATAASWMGRR
jgi:hypothetical protein